MISICRSQRMRLAFVWLVLSLPQICAGRIAVAQETDAEEAKEKSIVDRFVGVLEKNPRRGTALDKVYGYHVERGSLEGLIKTYREKTQNLKGAEAGSAWLIVGLLESMRGQDALAVTALEQAEKLAPSNYLASYYLGQSLILVGQPDKAAEALERSIERKPAQADLLEVYQALGRVYQRAQKADRALEVWNRLEKQFPDDARVQEQIATTLLEENEFAAALPRFEALAKKSKDRYRQSLFQMEAAGLKVRLGKADEGIADFEKLLGQLLPDNWLYRDVRRRIEGVYLRTDDQAGLIAYYENWIKKEPKDLDALSRLARLLAGYGRGPESQEWLQKGLKVAPKSKELRSALISQLVYEQKYADAIAQYEQIDKYGPNNPDTLREWGRLILKDTALDEAARKAGAANIWRRMMTAKPKDPLAASQVGELFRQAEMTDEALELYRKAIALAPDQAQYREYLGEYFHSQKRKDEALAEWRAIAEGPLKTPANVARLAEVLASFGYLAEAVETNAEACKLDPKDFSLQVKQVDLLSQADRHDDSITQLAVVKKLAANDEEREAFLSRELRELQALDQLTTRIAAVRSALDGKESTATPLTDAEKIEQWFWLARACESLRLLKDAAYAVTRASELAPQSIPVLMASARIHEAQNNLLAAVETNSKLAAIDRRYRTEYLKQVATLEKRLGRKDRAIQAGRDLIAAAPGNPELYEFFSQLCFQLGETEEGLGALRRSVRVNPTEPKGLLLLASALSEQFRTGESIELYWRAFEKAASLDDRLGVIPRLTELYLRTNQFDRILERLERQRREPNQQREMTICLAQAYQSAGDAGNARQELEKLLTEDTRDTQLLVQLVKLCESDGDLEAAIKFQQQLLKAAPGKEASMHLAQLLSKSGETEEAMAIMSHITVDEKDPETVLKSLDAMLAQGNYENAVQAAQKLSRDQPNNWELLYREAFALAQDKEKSAEASAVFEALLALKIHDDEPGLAEKNRAKKGQGIGRSPAFVATDENPMIQRKQFVRNIRLSVGLDETRNMNMPHLTWMPKDFGQTRMASLACLLLLARNAGTEGEFLKQRREAGEQANSLRELTDWYYLVAISNNHRGVYQVLKRLSLRPDADSDFKSLYLNSLASRGVGEGEVAVAVDPDADESHQIRGFKLPVLSNDEMEHVLSCYSALNEPTLMRNHSDNYLQVVIDELKRSGRKDEADKLLNETIEGAKSQADIAALIPATVDRNDFDGALGLLNRMSQMKPDSSLSQTNRSTANVMRAQRAFTPESQAQLLCRLMDKRVQKKKLDDVLKVWDWYAPVAAARRNASKSVTFGAQNPRAFQSGPAGYVLIWRMNSQQYENLDFPSANDVFDQPAIQVLRQAFTIYKEADLPHDLVEHVRQQLSDPKLSADQQVFLKCGLSYLLWWQGEKDDALTVLTEATEELQDHHEMRFELARAHEKHGDYVQALEIIDSLPVADQQAVKTREVTALRIAVNSGNIDRARLAAERLFGLRLDSHLQIQLAQQMHQLGMHEQAEAVLARAGRQAGNQTDVLANLMQQYQSQGKNDVAVQIAYQLLRRSGARNTSNRGSPRDPNSVRQHAFTVLKRSGKLPEMIKKVEGQLKNSPKSQNLLETLIEYYIANGDDKKAADLAASLSQSKQDDPQFRYKLGKQLLEQGKHAEAAAQFKIAFKKDPRLVGNNFWEIINAFQSADKLDELASIFDEMDFKAFRQNVWALTNVISNMSYQEKSKTRAVQLFKRAWKELPDQRSQLLSSLNQDVFWQMPEIYDYAKQGIIPESDGAFANGNWPGFGQIHNWGNQDGKIVTLVSRFLTLAVSKKKLDELVTEIEAAQQKLPQWEAAPALLAMIELRRGRVENAKATFEKMLPGFKSSHRGDYSQWEIGQELMAHESCIDLAIAYLEAASKDPNVMQMAQMNGFQFSPGKSLVEIYKRKGRKEDALKLLLSSTSVKGSRNNGNEAWEAYQRIQGVSQLAAEVTQLGYPVEAIRLYQEQLARSEDFVVAMGVFGGGTNATSQMDQQKAQLVNGMQSAISGLRPDLLPQLLMERKPMPGDPENSASIDLMLLIETRELNRIQLSSVIGKLISGLGNNAQLAERTRGVFADLLQRRRDDIPVKILEALLVQGMNERADYTEIVNQLAQQIEQAPLEQMPAKGGFTTKQRDAARQQVALWLIARDCLRHDPLRANGIKLAERSLESARRLTDNAYSLAVLREWGQILSETGDKDGAKRRWADMLDIVVPRPGDKSKLKASEDEKSKSGSVGEGSSRAGGSASQKNAVVTLAQFEQAVQIARLAIENGDEDLSFDAITRSLQSGPPIQALLAIDVNQGFQSRGNDDDEVSPVEGKMYEWLTLIERLWRQKGAAEESIYNALVRAVLPETRPFEVFLHPQSIQEANRTIFQSATTQTPRDVAALLAVAAVKAKKVDKLKSLIEPRLNQPLGEVPGRILLSQLALATKDIPQATEQITQLTNRLKPDSTKASNELASHIAIPAMNNSETRAVGTTLMELIVDHLANAGGSGDDNNSIEPLRTLRFALARSYFRHGNPDAGKRQLEEHLGSLTMAFQNYGGDYGQYMRRMELLNVAEQYARAGQRDDLLDCLGRYADMPVTGNYGQQGGYTASMMSALATLPAANSYEVLKAWSLPTDDRKSVRMVAGLLSGDHAPPVFDTLRGDGPRLPRETRFTSTASLLIQAATRSDRLEELRQELLPLADQNVEQAKMLLQLTLIAQGKGSLVLPDIERLLERPKPQTVVSEEESAIQSTDEPQQRNTEDLSNIVLATAAITDQGLQEKGRELLRRFGSQPASGNQQLASMVRHDYLAPVLDAETADRLDHEPWNSGLKHWTGASHAVAAAQAGSDPMWWLANEGLLCHLFGPGASQLYFNYPLIGEFEITCDAWAESWMENSICLGYEGTLINRMEAVYTRNGFWQQNGATRVQRITPRILFNQYNHVRFQVSREKVHYYVNGDLIHEQAKSSPASPWFYVQAIGASSTALRNLKITGQPEIPREIHLISRDSLRGWTSSFYSESIAQTSLDELDEETPAAPPVDQDADWQVIDHVVHGRRRPSFGLETNRFEQSRLYYDRPLTEGDRVRYEFWHETGANPVHVHPALGRLAFLLEPDGLKLHWMTVGNLSVETSNGLEADNVLVVDSIRRGQVTLKEKAWNAVEISLKNQIATIAVNGAMVAEYPLDRENSREFGFFHDKNATSVQIRNVMLQGDWPARISPEIAANLLAPARPLTPAQRRGFSRAIDETFHVECVQDRLAETENLPPAERYKALADWVLPNDDHVSLRLYGTFPSANGIPNAAKLQAELLAANKTAAAERRQYTNTEMIAPVFDLIRLARELGRLDEVKQQTEAKADDDAVTKRSKLALRILVQIAGNQLAQAAKSLDQLQALIETIDIQAPAEFWPILAAGQAGVQQAELRSAILSLLTQMADHYRQPALAGESDIRIIALRDRCRLLMETDKIPRVGGSSPRQQWITSRIEQPGAFRRAPASQWQFRERGVAHVGGEGVGYLYFQSPLRGTFSVEAEVSTSRGTETRLMYDGRWVGPDSSRKMIGIGSLTTQTQGPQLEPQLEFDEWCQLKLDVVPNKATWSINGRQVHDVTLPDKPNPWLGLTSGNHSGQARNVKISGKPEIPAELDLASSDDLMSWTAGLYDDQMGFQNPDSSNDDPNGVWSNRQGEIEGKKFVDVREQVQQSLLRYHRPLAEDGLLSYEFFYAKDDKVETHVHPALGRIAFLLLPDGVKLHVLTDADSDRDGLRPDNEIEDTGHRRGPAAIPLKEKQWNQLQLVLSGDQVQLKLNEIEIYAGPIATWNQREFGLFHYANQSDVRVRNVIYRGEWPKTLPDFKDQEFAGE